MKLSRRGTEAKGRGAVSNTYCIIIVQREGKLRVLDTIAGPKVRHLAKGCSQHLLYHHRAEGREVEGAEYRCRTKGSRFHVPAPMKHGANSFSAHIQSQNPVRVPLHQRYLRSASGGVEGAKRQGRIGNSQRREMTYGEYLPLSDNAPVHADDTEDCGSDMRLAAIRRQRCGSSMPGLQIMW